LIKAIFGGLSDMSNTTRNAGIQVSFNKLHASSRASKYLPFLKMKTGLTPNIVCRMGLCLSIAEPTLPDTKMDDDKGQEFSRYTLLGEWDPFFISILRERLIQDNLDPEKDLLVQFKAHLNRGIMILQSRIKDLSDIHDLLPAIVTPLEPKLNNKSSMKKKNQKIMRQKTKKN
jgi:DNA sulfur modification protein DndE